MQLEYGKHRWFSGKHMWQYAGNLGSILGSVKASKEYFLNFTFCSTFINNHILVMLILIVWCKKKKN